MTDTEFRELITATSAALIERYIGESPLTVALKLRNAPLVTQIKNLQKASRKIPSYYNARCIIPTVSYEQSSSEAVARAKRFSGETAIDMTCGLGVDSYVLAERFERVVALEVDPLRAQIARYNFEKLRVQNIEVVCSRAEDYNIPKMVDLIYLDPCRRTEDNRVIYSLEQSSPNVLEMMPRLRRSARRVAVKLSPLFDVQEALRVFAPGSMVEIISQGNECKEVLVIVDDDDHHPYRVINTIVGQREASFAFTDSDVGFRALQNDMRELSHWQFLHVADVSFYKSRTVEALMVRYYPGAEYCVESYIFTEDELREFPGKSFRILERYTFRPKSLRKKLALLGIKRANLHFRNFSEDIASITRSLGIQSGGSEHLFFLSFGDEDVVLRVEPVV